MVPEAAAGPAKISLQTLGGGRIDTVYKSGTVSIILAWKWRSHIWAQHIVHMNSINISLVQIGCPMGGKFDLTRVFSV